MAWKKVEPMEIRMQFVFDWKRNDVTMTELCMRYKISRKTGYQWLRRYQTRGAEGLRERSRRPHRHPTKTSAYWVQRVVELRVKHPRWGPKKFRAILRCRSSRPQAVPAASTLGGILQRAGLVPARRRRNRRRTLRREPLSAPQRPNEVWAVDYKGWFGTQDGCRCDPLTVSDVTSRYVLLARALPDQSYELAQKAFRRLFREYGLPERIRCDNGGPFASKGAGGLSRLSVWWMLQGIAVEWITPGHPEQNGVHERMHRTLKADTTQPPASTLGAQQQRFDRWRTEFNQERPHEGLSMRTPSQDYEPSSRRYTGRLQPPRYESAYTVRRVRSTGQIKWQGRFRFIGESLRGMRVGLKCGNEGRWEVYFGKLLLGELADAAPGGLLATLVVPLGRRKERQKGQKV
jgi:putative transposase